MSGSLIKKPFPYPILFIVYLQGREFPVKASGFICQPHASRPEHHRAYQQKIPSIGDTVCPVLRVLVVTSHSFLKRSHNTTGFQTPALSITLPAVDHHRAGVRRSGGFHSADKGQQSGGVIRHPVLRPGREVELTHLVLCSVSSLYAKTQHPLRLPVKHHTCTTCAADHGSLQVLISSKTCSHPLRDIRDKWDRFLGSV